MMPNFASVISSIKLPSLYTGRLLLSLSCAMLAVACDSQTSNEANDSSTTRQTTLTESTSDSMPQSAITASSNDNKASVDDNGSLLATAKPKENRRQVPMIADSINDNELQATLMGDYAGKLPCAFCDNVTVTLNLFADGSIQKTSVYVNPISPHMPLVESGVYRQDDDMITIVYSDKNIESYHIQDNHLTLMDKNKQPNADYTLSRK